MSGGGCGSPPAPPTASRFRAGSVRSDSVSPISGKRLNYLAGTRIGQLDYHVLLLVAVLLVDYVLDDGLDGVDDLGLADVAHLTHAGKYFEKAFVALEETAFQIGQLIPQNLGGCLIAEPPPPQHLLFQAPPDRPLQNEKFTAILTLVQVVDTLLIPFGLDFQRLSQVHSAALQQLVNLIIVVEQYVQVLLLVYLTDKPSAYIRHTVRLRTSRVNLAYSSLMMSSE